MPLDIADIPEEPRTVRPRKAGFVHLTIIAVDLRRRRFTEEDTGEIRPLDELPAYVKASPGALVAVKDAAGLVAFLDRHFTEDETFQWRAAIVDREYGAAFNRAPLIVEQEIFGYFGFRRRNGKEKGRWFHLLDPATFADVELAFNDLMPWAQDVRAFCATNDLPLRPTATGLAGLLLRDKRFWPDARRKIPEATNEKARQALPGNFYRAACVLDFPYKALYADMQAAHHTAAAGGGMPHGDELFARGFFRSLQDEPWLTPASPGYKDLRANHRGLFFVSITTPISRRPKFHHPLLELHAGRHLAFIFSNELAHLEAAGVTVNYFIAAWSSTKEDTGLAAYARFALDQLQEATPQRRRWLKVALLSAYGLLAARPRKMKTAYRQGTGEEVLVAGLTGHLREARKETQTPIANVVARGMIEADIRRRALEQAGELERAGKNVLAIYADGILHEGLPVMLPPPWRYEGASDRLYVLDEVSIIAADNDAIIKLPGRHGGPREELLKRYRQSKEGAG